MTAPNPILALLTGRLAPGVWSCPEAPDDLAALVTGLGWTPIVLDLRRSPDKPQILACLAAEAGFPDYYRPNWDATADCLKDLSGRKWLVIVRADGVDPGVAPVAVLLDVLSEVSGFWARHGRNFSTLWIGRPAPEESLALAEVC